MKRRLRAIVAAIAVMALTACASSDSSTELTEVQVGKVERVVYQQVEKKPALMTVLAGAALGGVIGNQIGGGSGKAIATGVGAIGGAAITDKSLTKHYNQVVYKIYLPQTQEVIGVVSGDVAATIFENDLVVVYHRGKQKTIDAYGQYSIEKYHLLKQQLADGTLE